MTTRCHSPWLRCLLAAAFALPPAGLLARTVYGIHFTDEWETSYNHDTPGMPFFGLAIGMPILVIMIWLAGKSALRADAEVLQAIAVGCGLIVLLSSITLAEAAAVLLGLKEGRVPMKVLAGFAGAWAYFAAVGLGHWYLARKLPPADEVRGQ